MAAISRNIIQKALYRTLSNFHLRSFKRLNFTFDPFHPSVTSIRDVLFHLSAERVRDTNVSCSIRTDIKDDRSEPAIEITLANDGKRYLIKTGYLTTLETVQQLDLLAKRYDPKPPEQDQ